MLKAGRDLKIVVCGGAGYDHVDVEAATKRGVWVCNNPDHVTEPTAEMSVALMLTVCRRVAEWDRLVRRDQYAYWGNAKRMGTTVMDKQLGIIGMGRDWPGGGKAGESAWHDHCLSQPAPADFRTGRGSKIHGPCKAS